MFATQEENSATQNLWEMFYEDIHTYIYIYTPEESDIQLYYIHPDLKNEFAQN